MDINKIHELCINEIIDIPKPDYWIGAWDDLIYYRKLFLTLTKEYQTNIVEIGSHNGSSSYFFGKILKPYNKIIYTIDPWNGMQEGIDTIYQHYLNNTKELHNLITFKESSLSEKTYQYLKTLNYGICYIDGLHTREGIRNDINIITKTIQFPHVIVIDDYDMTEVKVEIEDAIHMNKIKLIIPPNNDMFNNCYPNIGRKFAVCVKIGI